MKFVLIKSGLGDNTMVFADSSRPAGCAQASYDADAIAADAAISERGTTVKRAFDIAVSLVSLILLMPLLLMIGALILIKDGRPILFGHTRIGCSGRSFRCLKFRTMVRAADQQLEAYLRDNPAARVEWDTNFKLWDDPRIIAGVGEFLRRTSLDELPQLWNVLVGDMSLVGPRPVTESELQLYGSSVGAYLSIRPGLTGPWQVSGRSNVAYDQRVRLDEDYVRHRTLLLDLRILLATVFVVIRREGAA